jgi:hypothetical protein
MDEIIFSYKDCYELQLIDCNCNNCFFMERNLEVYKKWEDYHRAASQKEFDQSQTKAISDAQNVIDSATCELELKSGNGMMRVAQKMKFYFEKKWLLQYGKCLKFNKPVSFMPVTCQIETQQCFVHRRDTIIRNQAT